MCPLADEVTLAMIYLAAFDCGDPMKRGISLRHVEIQVPRTAYYSNNSFRMLGRRSSNSNRETQALICGKKKEKRKKKEIGRKHSSKGKGYPKKLRSMRIRRRRFHIGASGRVQIRVVSDCPKLLPRRPRYLAKMPRRAALNYFCARGR